MSKAKELKLNPENNLNLSEMFSKFVPEGKSKYLDLLFRIMKGTSNYKSHVNEIKEYFKIHNEIPTESWNDTPDLNLIYFYTLVDSLFNKEDIKSFQKFCEYNERNLIKQNDLSRYKSYEDIHNSLSIAEAALDIKNMEKQVKILLNDEEWLILRPLTFEASKKYGSNTKWCTTQQNNPDYFMKYSKRGVLIYCINKVSGYKVASFYSLDKNEPEFSFWNQKDSRIDSLEADIPDNVRLLIKEESLGKGAKTNRFLLGDAERTKEEKLLNMIGFKSGSIDIPEAPVEQNVTQEIPTAPGRIRNAIERLQNETEVSENDLVRVSNENAIGIQESVPVFQTARG